MEIFGCRPKDKKIFLVKVAATGCTHFHTDEMVVIIHVNPFPDHPLRYRPQIFQVSACLQLRGAAQGLAVLVFHLKGPNPGSVLVLECRTVIFLLAINYFNPCKESCWYYPFEQLNEINKRNNIGNVT